MDDSNNVEKARLLELRFSLEVVLWLAEVRLHVDTSYRGDILSLGRRLASMATGFDMEMLEFADIEDEENDNLPF